MENTIIETCPFSKLHNGLKWITWKFNHLSDLLYPERSTVNNYFKLIKDSFPAFAGVLFRTAAENLSSSVNVLVCMYVCMYMCVCFRCSCPWSKDRAPCQVSRTRRSIQLLTEYIRWPLLATTCPEFAVVLCDLRFRANCHHPVYKL